MRMSGTCRCALLGTAVLAGLAALPGRADALSDAQNAYAAQGLGMFVHFNMATYTDEEWASPAQKNINIFNPSQFNTDQWAWAAKAAGMKYMVLTTKHVDGFALWNTTNSTYNATNTGWAQNQPAGQGDIIQRFINSAHKYGLGVGLYYSMWDMSHGIYQFPSQSPLQDPHSADYNVAYDINEVTQLLHKYGPVEGIWTDSFGTATPGGQSSYFNQVNAAVKAISPTTLLQVNQNLLQGIPSDIVEYESTPIPNGNTVPSEYLDTLKTNGNWFYHPDGSPLQSVASVMANTQAANQNNATHLLDVTPDRRGLIPADQIQRLIEIGQARGVSNLPQAPWVAQKPGNGGMLANPSFESSTPHLGNPNGGVDGGWIGTGNATVTTDAIGAAADGHKYVVFSPSAGAPTGQIQQTFNTIPGQTYAVWFRLGTLTSGRDNAGVRIVASGNPSADDWIQSPAAADSTNPYWEALDQFYSFTATSLTTTLDITDITDYSGATTNALLDNFVVSPTPEPAAMAGAALGMMALLRRSRRRSLKADFKVRASGPSIPRMPV